LTKKQFCDKIYAFNKIIIIKKEEERMQKFFNSIMGLLMLLAALGLSTTSAVYLGSKTPFFQYTKLVGRMVVAVPTPAIFGWIWWVSAVVLAVIFLIRPLRKAATDPF